MTYWTYEEIKTKVENDLDLQQETFITPTELMGYCNEAIDMIEAEIHTLYEDYFLTYANIALVAGTAEYSLPSDIYAMKIRSILYNNGSDTYEIMRIRKPTKFIEAELTNKYNTTTIYNYMVVNKSATDGVKLYLVPKSLETSSANVKIWYIRNANRITATTDKIDIPEFVNVIIQYIKVRCYEKEMHPNLQQAMDVLAGLTETMIDTLSGLASDENTEVIPDVSHYEDSANYGL